MIAVDTNILVHAHREDSPFHEAAFSAVRTLAEAPAPWAVPWPCLHEFLAIVTHPRIFEPPSTVEQAIGQVDAWLESPSIVLLTETVAHWPALRHSLGDGHVHGAQVHDARIAALCVQHGIDELWTADRDFSRYPRLRTHNPLLPVRPGR